MSPDRLLKWLDACVENYCLRPLDRAFVRFLKAQRTDSSSLVLLAAALASHQLGRGHVCLDLRIVLSRPRETLSWPSEGEQGIPSVRLPALLFNDLTPEAWTQSLHASPLVGSGDGDTPLVLSHGRLYLRRYWRYTHQVARHLTDRMRRQVSVPADLARRIDHHFGLLRSPAEEAKTEIHWQSVAAAVAAASAFSVISGGPGTGKTTTVVHLLGLLQAMAVEQGQPLRIRLAAPTGKAAARLTESIGHAMDQLPETLRHTLPTEVTTLHRMLGRRPDTRRFTYHAGNPLHMDVLVVDEASMIDLEMMAALLEALPADARLTLLGDKDQLASVEAGAVLGDLCRGMAQPGYRRSTCDRIEGRTGYRLQAYARPGPLLDQHIVVLQKSHRFGQTSGIGALARAVNAGDPRQVAGIWQQKFADITQVVVPSVEASGFTRLVLDGATRPGERAPTAGYRAYIEKIRTGPGAEADEETWLMAVLEAFNRFQLLSPLRRGPWGVEYLNQKTALALFAAKLIDAIDGWYPGRPVMITRNDYALGLMNGDTGIVVPVSDPHSKIGKSLKVVFATTDGTLKKIRPSRLNDVETVYAMTVHKSQGSEFDHTALVFPDAMSPLLTRELIYTAITRSRSRFTLVRPDIDLLPQAVQRRVHRASGLGALLRQDESDKEKEAPCTSSSK